jgi:DNA-binding SARP family transcriptional activator
MDVTSAYVVSMIAESVLSQADVLSDEAWRTVSAEALRRPVRWKDALLMAARAGSERCAGLAAAIGDDVTASELRGLALDNKALRPAALHITGRLARQVEIVDLGQIEVALGGTRLSLVRRKVLGLLAYLGSRPTMAATRDEILEALWAELRPETAANSLHQTIYFLRRAFEPDYREGLSAGYLTYDGEVVELSERLCDSLSRRCWRAIRRLPQDPTAVREVVELYRGRFALDFAYDDWASDYRDNLHAAVLAAAESGIQRSIAGNDYDEAIRIAHRVLAIDSEADAIELLLLRAYKLGGRQAAAAEQYVHYSAAIRELGAEPLTFDDV